MANQNDMSAMKKSITPGPANMAKDMQKKCDEGEHYMHGAKECMKDSAMKSKGK